MNLKEKQDVIRTAAIIRTARKLRGKTQLEVADHLGVSQSFLSKLENAILIPSASHWFSFCHLTEINPVKTFESGFIDHLLSLTMENPYPSSAFKLHSKFLANQASMVRDIRPFIAYFIEKLGEERFEQYCNEQEVDPDFFRVLDNSFNMRFTLELITMLIQKGVLTSKDLPSLVRSVSEPLAHGYLHENYDQATDSMDLISRFIENREKYELNFSYQIAERNRFSLVLAISPNPILDQFEYKNEVLNDFLCQYRQHYIKSFASYRGNSRPTQIQEKQCHFRGSNQCIYEICVEN